MCGHLGVGLRLHHAGISLALLLLLFLRWCGVLGFSYPFFPFVGVRVWRLGELIIYIGSSYVYGPMHFPGKDTGEAPQARCSPRPWA